MDQLKPILAQCQKHLFWIVTGIAVITGTVGFFLASSTLGSLFNTQKSALDTHYQNIQTVRSAVSTHPNQASQDQMQKIIDRVAKDVEQAWRLQYERQERFLVWPDSIRKLSPALVNRLDKLRPIELKTNYPEEPAGITPGYKRTFARYFDEDMPRLAKIIGVEWVGEVAAGPAAGGMGMGMGGYGGGGYGGGYGGSDGGYGGSDGDYTGGEGDYGGDYGGMGGYGGYGGGTLLGSASGKRDLVTWPKDSQDELLASMRLWQGNEPTVFQILYTQENMWILEGLLNIIKKTNGNARANFQCVIKEVEFIRIGRTAVGKAGVITGATGGATDGYGGGYGAGYGGGGYGAGGYGSEGEGSGYGGEGYGDGGSDSMYGEGSGLGTGVPAVTTDPANNRYVDANFQPVSGDDLRSKMQSSSPDDAYFAVAKRVPVRMRFTIDQRRTHEFLANCGNADLMLEIRQVRLGDTEPAGAGAAGGSAGGYGGMAGMMGGMMGGPGGTMDGDGYGGEGGYGGAALNASPSTFDLDIEVYGIVYLFNPVDIDRLGLGQVTEDTKLDDTVEPQEIEPAPPVDTGAATGEQPVEAGDPTAPADTSGQPGQPNAGQPADAGSGQPTGGQPGGGQPGQPAGGQPGGGQPGQPGGGQPGPGQPGGGQPGQPAGGQPGGGQPGQPTGGQPGPGQPGGGQPGQPGQPGGGQPGAGQPDPGQP